MIIIIFFYFLFIYFFFGFFLMKNNSVCVYPHYSSLRCRGASGNSGKHFYNW